MKDLFEEEFDDRFYPFNKSLRDYNVEALKDECHLNQK